MTVRQKSSNCVVNISAASHAKLQEFSRSEHRTMGKIVDELIKRYDDEQFWMRARESVERLRADPVAWQDYMDELLEWDVMGSDGLENEEPYYTPEEEQQILANARRIGDE